MVIENSELMLLYLSIYPLAQARAPPLGNCASGPVNLCVRACEFAAFLD